MKEIILFMILHRSVHTFFGVFSLFGYSTCYFFSNAPKKTSLLLCHIFFPHFIDFMKNNNLSLLSHLGSFLQHNLFPMVLHILRNTFPSGSPCSKSQPAITHLLLYFLFFLFPFFFFGVSEHIYVEIIGRG